MLTYSGRSRDRKRGWVVCWPISAGYVIEREDGLYVDRLGHVIEKEDWLYIDLFRRVTWSKVRMGCMLAYSGGSCDRKWGCLFGNLTSFSPVAHRVADSWFSACFIFWIGKENPWNIFLLLSLLCWIRKNEAILVGLRMWVTYFHQRLWLLGHFVDLQPTPTTQPRFWFRLPWWPHLMNMNKNELCVVLT